MTSQLYGQRTFLFVLVRANTKFARNIKKLQPVQLWNGNFLDALPGEMYGLSAMAIIMWFFLGFLASTEAIQVREGLTANMPFILDRSFLASFKVQVGNRRPFYDSALAGINEAGLTEDQHGRFSVQLLESPEDTTTITASVVIENVLRTDEDTYICTSDLGEGLFLRKRLTVQYPPGKAVCTNESESVPVFEGWARLTCIAAIGNIEGSIECYQRCGKIPYCSKENDGTNLKSIFWIKRSLPGVCCSSSSDEPKRSEDCGDFTWDPLEIIPETDCPSCTTTSHSQSSEIFTTGDLLQSSTESSLEPAFTRYAVSGGGQSKCGNDVQLRNVFIALTVVLSFVSMALCIYICYLKQNISNKRNN